MKTPKEIIEELEKELEYEQMQYDIGVEHPTYTEQFMSAQGRHFQKIQEMRSKLEQLKQQQLKELTK